MENNTIKESITEGIAEKNDVMDVANASKISSIFQLVTMSGLLFVLSAGLFFSYSNIKYNLDFEVHTPVITTDTLGIDDPEAQGKMAKEIFDEFINVRNKFEIQLFAENFAAFDRDDISGLKFFNKFSAFLDKQEKRNYSYSEVIEHGKIYGDSFYDEKTKRRFLTASKYYFIVRQLELDDEFLAPQPRYYAYEVSFDKEMMFKDFNATDDVVLNAKYKYIDYLKSITPENLINNVSLSSNVSPVALSHKDIRKVSYSKFRIEKTINNQPSVSLLLHINNEKFPSYVKREVDGTFSLYIDY